MREFLVHAGSSIRKSRVQLQECYRRDDAERTWISIDVISLETAKEGIPCRVHALNPFGYRRSGKEGYPKSFNVKPEGGGSSIKMIAHTWPPNADQPEYRCCVSDYELVAFAAGCGVSVTQLLRRAGRSKTARVHLVSAG